MGGILNEAEPKLVGCGRLGEQYRGDQTDLPAGGAGHFSGRNGQTGAGHVVPVLGARGLPADGDHVGGAEPANLDGNAVRDADGPPPAARSPPRGAPDYHFFPGILNEAENWSGKTTRSTTTSALPRRTAKREGSTESSEYLQHCAK